MDKGAPARQSCGRSENQEARSRRADKSRIQGPETEDSLELGFPIGPCCENRWGIVLFLGTREIREYNKFYFGNRRPPAARLDIHCLAADRHRRWAQ
jgi:hypothetical protein